MEIRQLFVEMIKTLRTDEQVILYDNMLLVNDSEAAVVSEFLEQEYLKETLTYPHIAPAFDTEAALWAAKTTYFIAQLILYREQDASELDTLLLPFEGSTTPSAMLSADLCLRFLPQLLTPLKMINPEDKLITRTEALLYTWPYSAISAVTDIQHIDTQVVVSDTCLQQLYVDRVIKHKHLDLALQPAIYPQVKASLGMYAGQYWNEFETERIIFLGDLFHSNYNSEWELFQFWRQTHASTEMLIVLGNHDILPRFLFEESNIRVYVEDYTEEGFVFAHHPVEEAKHGFLFAGHVHPVFTLRGTARQSLRIPCFLQSTHQMILPCFGVFTGGYEVNKIPHEAVYVVSGKEVLKVG